MKPLLLLSIAVILCACSSPEQRRKWAREDAQADARRGDGNDSDREVLRDEERWDKFLSEYAWQQGKQKNELTPPEIAEARRAFAEGEHYRRRY